MTLTFSRGSAFNFPAGEAHAVQSGGETPNGEIGGRAWVYLQGTDGQELMQLAMWADLYKWKPKVLFLPYLPAARMDRGIPFGARVYAEFINSMGFDKVICVDPHSDVAPALYNNLVRIDLDELFQTQMVASLKQKIKGHFTGIIAPDVGARKRAELAASVFKLPIYQAFKHRDFKTGKLSGFTCDSLPEGGTYLMVDDLCDGGGTFLGLADEIGLHREQLGLWVTHGIFSQDIGILSSAFGWIGTTDSYNPDLGTQRWLAESQKAAKATVIKLLPILIDKDLTTRMPSL